MSHDHSQNHYGPNASFDGHDSDLASAGILIESLRQQLSAALAACKLKDDALERIASINLAEYILPEDFAFRVLQVRKALAIQPDDALKAWIGEPVAWMITYDGKCMGFVPTEEANTVAVYSPKGLK